MTANAQLRGLYDSLNRIVEKSGIKCAKCGEMMKGAWTVCPICGKMQGPVHPDPKEEKKPKAEAKPAAKPAEKPPVASPVDAKKRKIACKVACKKSIYAQLLEKLDGVPGVPPMPAAFASSGMSSLPASVPTSSAPVMADAQPGQQGAPPAPDVQREQPKIGPSEMIGYYQGAVLDEVKAVAIYDSLANVAFDEPSRTMLLHIRDEEVQHVEELKMLISGIQKRSTKPMVSLA